MYVACICKFHKILWLMFQKWHPNILTFFRIMHLIQSSTFSPNGVQPPQKWLVHSKQKYIFALFYPLPLAAFRSSSLFSNIGKEQLYIAFFSCEKDCMAWLIARSFIHTFGFAFPLKYCSNSLSQASLECILNTLNLNFFNFLFQIPDVFLLYQKYSGKKSNHNPNNL